MTADTVSLLAYGVFLMAALFALAICCLACLFPRPARLRKRDQALARILRFTRGGR